MKLNAAGQEQSERECSECRRTDNLRPNPKEADKGELCPLCAAIYGISQKLTEEDIFFAVSDSRADGALPLPGAWLSVVREKQLRELLAKGQIKRFYTKNKLLVGDLMAANLWMGDYRSEDNDFNELAKPAKGETGIERIIALRADVDNLGHAFVNGLKGKKGSKLNNPTPVRGRKLTLRHYDRESGEYLAQDMGF
ncbi:MAG: hypothetical protein IJD04_04535, partial [Desulfovibrionaceae bacterium]|nr:hypothetical protein [Desulfovibrionaceae bacterium]